MRRQTSFHALACALAATTFAPAAMAETREDSAPVTTSAAASTTAASTDIKPPVAVKKPHTYTVHGITVEDPYDWLYDKSYPTVDDEAVLDHLKAENAYFEAKMEGQKALTDALFAEMRARI